MGLFDALETQPAAELLSWAIATYGPKFAIATSFQKEGMVIIDLACRVFAGAPRVFTLDTGRLPEETHQMMEAVRQRYGIAVELVFPEHAALEALISIHGPNLFYQSPERRERCCEIRKVEPMRRKLREFEAWAAGMRREQSELRAGLPKAEEIDGRLRLCPLADWTTADVDEYIEAQRVPVHPLYQQGYTSIGCAPCTRAISAGEDPRAGRWWWEDRTTKECGIHYAPDGTVARDA